MQLVEIELDPNETVIGEAGAMMFMEDGIKFESKFGDGSEAKTGFFKSKKRKTFQRIRYPNNFFPTFSDFFNKSKRVSKTFSSPIFYLFVYASPLSLCFFLLFDDVL